MPGPFTSEDELRRYVSSEMKGDVKNKKMHNEVKYVRIGMFLKPITSIFSLKQNHKNFYSIQKNILEL